MAFSTAGRGMLLAACAVVAAALLLWWAYRRGPEMLVPPRAPTRAPDQDGPTRRETAPHQESLAVRVECEPAAATQWRFAVRFFNAPGEPSGLLPIDRAGVGAESFAVPWPHGSRHGVVRLSYGNGAWQEVVVDSPLQEEVTFVIQEPWTLRGKVRGADGASLSGAGVTLFPHETERRPKAARRWPMPTDVQGKTDDHGEFALSGLDPSVSYDLAAVVVGYQVARRKNLSSSPGTTKEIELVLEPAGRIVGTLLDADGRPVTGVDLTIERVANQESGGTEWAVEGTMVTDSDGGFVCECLSGGHKKVIGTPRYERGRTTLVQFKAEIFAGRTTDVGAIVIGSGILELRVVHADRTAAAGARVRLTASPSTGALVPGDIIIAYVFADQQGIARVEGLSAVHLDLLIVDEAGDSTGRVAEPARVSMDYDGGKAVREVVLGDGETVDPGGGRLRIRLKDPARKAVVFALAGSRLLFSTILGVSKSDHEVPTSVERGEDVDVYFVQKGKYGHRRLSAGELKEVCEVTADLEGLGLWACVVDAAGMPVRRATVLIGVVAKRDAEWIDVGFTDDEGRFSIQGVPSDRTWFVAARTPTGFTQIAEWRNSSQDRPIELKETPP